MTAAPILARADPALRFGFSEGAPLGVSSETNVIELRGVRVRYKGAAQDVFEGVDLSLQAGCRVAIMGRNGGGKSTLAGLIAGTIEPTRGEVLRARGLRVAFYTQQCVDDLAVWAEGGTEEGGQPEPTPLAYMASCFPQMKEQELRALLGSFGVTVNMVRQPFRTLSGGQRVRTALARLAAERPHILLMDEPTNHLDIYSIAALQDALRAFKGGVVVISHDQSLLKEVAEEVLVVTRKGTGVKRFAGTVEEYLERRNQ